MKKTKKPKLRKDGTVDKKELQLYLFKKIRKPTPPGPKVFKDKSKYNRKKKHLKKEE